MAILCVFSFCSLDNSTSTKLFSYFDDGEVCFYCSSMINQPENAIVWANGEGCIVETDIKNAIKIGIDLTNCNGFSIKTDKTERSLEEIINNIQIVKQEIVSNIEIIYGYICGLINFTYIEGKKVNIQIAENGDVITIGSPIILGSY